MKPQCQFEGCKAEGTIKVRRRLKKGQFAPPSFYQLCPKHSVAYNVGLPHTGKER
jgi:hypothetical protein